MGNLSDAEKINYITNTFHQYFDIELNTTITATTEAINLVIPVSSLIDKSALPNTKIYSHDVSITDDFNINDFLSKMEDTDIQPTTKQCYCSGVIDGDTFYARILLDIDEDNKPIYETRKVRLVGVDTPEFNFDTEDPPEQGAEDSKRFLEKVCYSEDFYRRLHSDLYVRDFDLTPEELTALNLQNKIGRVIKKYKEVENKTTGEIEIKIIPAEEREVFINKKKIYLHIDQVKEYQIIKNKNGTIDKRTLAVLIVDNKNINKSMLKAGIAQVMYIPPCEFNSFDWADKTTEHSAYHFPNSSIEFLAPYLNSDMTNLVFTPQDDYTKIYRFEVYKDVIYVKLKPFSRLIRVHLLPKGYNCSNNILLLKDNMLERRTITVGKEGDYRINENKGINAYYQIDSIDRNRDDISEEDKDFNPNDFHNTFCEFDYDISDLTENLKNLMICVGYRYNQTSPFYAIHYTGVKDNHQKPIEEKCTLIDANWDTIIHETKTNYITQMEYTGSNIHPPKHNRISLDKSVLEDAYSSIPHTENIGKLYQKKLKYINDDLYAEEELNGTHYGFAEWRNINDLNERTFNIRLLHVNTPIPDKPLYEGMNIYEDSVPFDVTDENGEIKNIPFPAIDSDVFFADGLYTTMGFFMDCPIFDQSDLTYEVICFYLDNETGEYTEFNYRNAMNNDDYKMDIPSTKFTLEYVISENYDSIQSVNLIIEDE